MDANPIGLVILAIGALIGAGTLLVKHWSQIWGNIKQWAAERLEFHLERVSAEFLLPPARPGRPDRPGRDRAGQALEAGDRRHPGSCPEPVAVALERLRRQDPRVFSPRPSPAGGNRFISFTRNRLIRPHQKRAGVTWSAGFHDHFVTPIGRFITQTVPNAFRTGVNAIKGFWGLLGSIVRAPVNFLIGTVYDNGIRRLWNDVVAKIPGIPVAAHDQPAGPGRAGSPGSAEVTSTRRCSKRVRRWWISTARGRSHRCSRRWASPATRGWAASSAGSADSCPGSGTASPAWLPWQAALLTGNTAAFGNALRRTIGTHAPGALGQMMTGIPKALIKDLLGIAHPSAGTFGNIGHFGIGVGLYGPIVAQVLKLLGLSAGLEHNVLYQMQTESGVAIQQLSTERTVIGSLAIHRSD